MERMTLSCGMSPIWKLAINIPAPASSMLTISHSPTCSGVPTSGVPENSEGPPADAFAAGDLDACAVRLRSCVAGGKEHGHREREAPLAEVVKVGL